MTIPRPVTAVSGPDPTAPEAIKRKSGKKVIAVAVVAMLLVAGGLIFFFNSGNQGGTPGETYTTITPEDEKVLLVDEADRHCVYLSGDFYSTNNGQPALSASFNSIGKLKVEIATAYAQHYATFKWELSGENNFKTESPALKTNYYNAFTTFGFGSYNVQVKCTAADGSSMIFSGDIASYVYYQWVYQNDVYSTIGIVSYEEYYNYTNSMAHGAPTVWSSDVFSSFAPIDASVNALSANLRELYGKSHTTVEANQPYADFILAFVQCTTKYTIDFYGYGETEYWAYPVQTIYNGFGDCEDSSLLCAALFTAAGFTAAVSLIPGHAICGVVLDNYVKPTQTSYTNSKGSVFGLSTYSQTPTVENPDNYTYWCCETTADGPVAVGLEPNSGVIATALTQMGKTVAEGENYSFYMIQRTLSLF